jgi:membrane protein YdbS with pleckstrin-like domain
MAGEDFTSSFMTNIMPKVIPMLKWGFVFVGIIVIVIVLVILIINSKKRKWKIEIHEMKADGKLHTVGYDILEERKIDAGRKTIYWLRKAKCEAVPPPHETVDRFRGKEEVDYLRVARDYIPTTKRLTVNYNDPKIKAQVIEAHDNIIKNVRETRTSYFNSEPVRDRFINIPLQKTLTANMMFEPIDYDVSMMAMNEIHNADDFYASKYEFWKKYGAIIVFAITIVFLIILIVLTYEYLVKVVGAMMGQITANTNMLQGIVDKMGGGKPPA